MSEGPKSGIKRFKVQNYKSLIDMNLGGESKDAVVVFSSQSDESKGVVKIVKLSSMGNHLKI